jgi:hypothetical protein
MRIIKSIFAGIFFTVFLIVATSLIISFVYEDQVSQIFLKEINKRVKTEISTEKINLSLLKKFPYATVYFEEIKISASDKRSILKSEELFLQFDIVDLFTKNYNIDKITISNGTINILDQQNWENPIPLKENSSSSLEVHLKELLIKKVKLNINNNDQDFKLMTTINHAEITGNFTSDKKKLDVDSELIIHDLSNAGFSYISGKEVSLNQKLAITPSHIHFAPGNLSIANIPLSTQGKFSRKKQIVDINITGKRLNIKEINVNVPWLIKEKADFLTFDNGKISFIASAKGPVKTGRPYIETDFNIVDSKVQINENNDLKFKDVSLKGYFSNGIQRHPASSILVLNNIQTNWKNNEIEGNLKIENFLDPDLRINTNGNIKLHKTKLAKRIPKLKNTEGNVSIKLNYQGKSNELKNLKSVIQNNNLRGELTIENGTIELDNNKFHDINGFIYLKEELFLDRLHLTTMKTNLKIDGKIFNPAELLTDSTSSMNANLHIYSDFFDANKMMNNNRMTQDSTFSIPSGFSGNLHLKFGKFLFKDFSANNLKGSLRLNPKSIDIERLSLNTAEGNAVATGEIAQINDSTFRLNNDFILNHIGINQTFKSFKNFGQQYITSGNLKGYMNGKIHFSGNISSDLKMDLSSLLCVSNISIRKGELIDFEPMERMAKFVELQELKHIKFSELSNKITIKNSKISIPEMEINSSAFNLNIAGWHKFDNTFSYNINLLLSEVLSKKVRKKNPKTEFGYIQEDGVGKARLYIKLYGETENYEIEYDKEGVKEKIKTDIEEEKKELKQILNEEFGWFKKDTAITDKDTSANNNRFNIEWEESEEKKKKKKKDEKKNDNPFIIKWEEDTLSN